MKRTIILLTTVLMPLLASAQLNITSGTQSYKTLASARVGNVKLKKAWDGFDIAASTNRGRSLILHLGDNATQAIATLEDMNRLLNTMEKNDFVSVYSQGCSIIIRKITNSTLSLQEVSFWYEGSAYLYRGEINKFLRILKKYD